MSKSSGRSYLLPPFSAVRRSKGGECRSLQATHTCCPLSVVLRLKGGNVPAGDKGGCKNKVPPQSAALPQTAPPLVASQRKWEPRMRKGLRPLPPLCHPDQAHTPYYHPDRTKRAEGSPKLEDVRPGGFLAGACLSAKKFFAFGTNAPRRQNFRNDRKKEGTKGPSF